MRVLIGKCSKLKRLSNGVKRKKEFTAGTTASFHNGLFNPDWQLQFQTVAQELSGYFDRVEAKSRGRERALERKRIVSLEKQHIGKETNPLATVDSGFPDDDTLEDFASSQFIVAEKGINWGAIEPHFEASAKASGIGLETLQKARARGGRLSAENMERLKSVLYRRRWRHRCALADDRREACTMA
jgi:hypothetical protein